MTLRKQVQGRLPGMITKALELSLKEKQTSYIVWGKYGSETKPHLYITRSPFPGEYILATISYSVWQDRPILSAYVDWESITGGKFTPLGSAIESAYKEYTDQYRYHPSA